MEKMEITKKREEVSHLKSEIESLEASHAKELRDYCTTVASFEANRFGYDLAVIKFNHIYISKKKLSRTSCKGRA
jgi:hypothetical protein